jgi:hypothetical protein
MKSQLNWDLVSNVDTSRPYNKHSSRLRSCHGNPQLTPVSDAELSVAGPLVAQMSLLWGEKPDIFGRS